MKIKALGKDWDYFNNKYIYLTTLAVIFIYLFFLNVYLDIINTTIEVRCDTSPLFGNQSTLIVLYSFDRFKKNQLITHFLHDQCCGDAAE